MTDKFKKKYKNKLQQALAECETGIQANAICEVTNVLIDYIIYQEIVVTDIKNYIQDSKVKIDNMLAPNAKKKQTKYCEKFCLC